MSHIAKVKIEIKSLDDLARACQRIGLELVVGQTTFYETSPKYARKCKHAIRPQSPEALQAYNTAVVEYGLRACQFPFGVKAKRGGGFEVVFESMTGSYCGPVAAELRKSYAAVAAIGAARSQGFRVQESRLQTGEIKLVFSK